MRIDIITLFPQVFPGPLAASIPGRVLDQGLAELHAHDLRQWGIGKHRSVDDYPYGGGAGMIMRPVFAAARKNLKRIIDAGYRLDGASDHGLGVEAKAADGIVDELELGQVAVEEEDLDLPVLTSQA